jgi:Mrp family chromosome partitioning ATPase
MVGAEGMIHSSEQGWVPVHVPLKEQKGSLVLISLGFLTGKTDPIIWRGPKKNAMVEQFLNDVWYSGLIRWDELDYLIVDTPPGTSDEHISVIQSLKKIQSSLSSPYQLNAVIVTTPQQISALDVRKQLTFLNKV